MTKTKAASHQDIRTEVNGRVTAVCYGGMGAAMTEIKDGTCDWCGDLVSLPTRPACDQCGEPSGRPCRPWCPTEAHEDH